MRVPTVDDSNIYELFCSVRFRNLCAIKKHFIAFAPSNRLNHFICLAPWVGWRGRVCKCAMFTIFRVITHFIGNVWSSPSHRYARQETEWKIHLRQSAATRLDAWIEKRKIWNLRFYSPSEDLFLLHWTFIRFSCENKYWLTRIYLLRRRLAVVQVTTAKRFQYARGRITASQWIVVSNWRRTEINSVNKYLYRDESHCAISDKCFPTIRTTVDRFMAHFGASFVPTRR